MLYLITNIPVKHTKTYKKLGQISKTFSLPIYYFKPQKKEARNFGLHASVICQKQEWMSIEQALIIFAAKKKWKHGIQKQNWDNSNDCNTTYDINLLIKGSFKW